MMMPNVRDPRIIFRANGSMPLFSHPRSNFPPQLALAGAGLRGVGKNGLDIVLARERVQGMAELVAGELIGFGGDHQEVAVGVAQEVDELPVRRLCWDIGVDEHDGQLQRRAIGEIWLDELWPL